MKVQSEHQMKVQPKETIPSLTNAKHSSSLQSLLHKDQGKNHKIASSTNNRPVDLYQHSQHVTNCSATTTVIPSVVFPVSSPTVAPNLPAQYYFNCTQDVCEPPSNQGRAVAVEEAGAYGISESLPLESSSLVTETEDSVSERQHKSGIQLSESYASVSSVTAPSKGHSSLSIDTPCSNESFFEQSVRAPSVVLNPNSTSQLVTQQTISVTQPGQFVTGSTGSYISSNSSLGKTSSDHRKPNLKKSKGNKGLKETKLIADNIPGFRGNGDVDELVQFVEGTPVGKRGNKKKERENRGKAVYGNETFVKSMSLDDDNLSFAAKNTGDRGDGAASLKDAAGVRSDRGRCEKDKKYKDCGKTLSSPGTKKSLTNQGNRRESDQEDNKSPLRDQAEPKFTVVIRKRKTKTACITSPTGSSTGKELEKQKDPRRSRSRGDRRKSVGSVPSSEQSEGSDDGSVRSLPAGECTKREEVPKSCASSGGTPQTSYADIARLTKDEENKKELTKVLADYPSLHGSENSETSDDFSDGFVPIDDVASKEICGKSNPSGGGTPHTSYADIARLASHEEKKDHLSEDFPELSSTIGVIPQESFFELLPSPTSDSNTPVAKNGNNDSAFPHLTSCSASKLICTPGPLNKKTMSSSVSANPATGTSEVSNSLPVSSSNVPRAPTPTSKAQFNPASLASQDTPVPPSAKCNVSTISGGTGYASCVSNPAPYVNASRVLNTNVLLNSASDCREDKFESPVCPNGKSKPNEVTDFIVNGQLSDSYKDKAIRARDIGAKLENFPISVVVPQPYIVDSDLAGQCTEAVVFCGENFKEQPPFASRNLEFEFGFNVNEALIDIKQISDSPSGSKNGFNKKQSKVKNVSSLPSREVQENFTQQPSNTQLYTSISDDAQTKTNQTIVRNKNQFVNRNTRNSVSTNNGRHNSPRNYDASNPEKAQQAHHERNQLHKGVQHRITNNAKKPVQIMQPILSESVLPVATQMASVDGYKNPTVVTAFPLNVNPVHLNSGIPHTMYGMTGYVSGIPQSVTYQNRLPGMPHNLPAPGLLPVQLPPAAFECPQNQYVSSVFQRVPPAPDALVADTEDPNCIIGAVTGQSQHPAPVGSEYRANSPGAVVQGRPSYQVIPTQAGYYQVPEPHVAANSDSDSGPTLGQTLVPVDLSNVAGMFIPSNIVFEYPVNFAQYYLPPDPSPYNNVNVADLRSYLERRKLRTAFPT